MGPNDAVLNASYRHADGADFQVKPLPIFNPSGCAGACSHLHDAHCGFLT